ncbi:hypothetical protein C4568_03065 [Candidatus Parcubacteria bacterium]|nr:MAG: hypothetical protein C4568_03065 [Candidatus Parcubacteria bacterium]
MRAILRIFTNVHSTLLALAVSLFVFVLAVWLPNLRLLFQVWTDASVSLGDKVALPINLLPSIATNFTPLSASYTIAIAILTGINVALIIHLIKTRGMLGQGTVVGASGIFTGALGLGCAACGSIILTSLVGTAGGVGILALLPLRGSEFGIIGVVLLGYSTYLLAKQINKPLVC